MFRATHGLPPCDDESYDPYGPYGDLGDVETDEVLALDSFPPNKKCSFVPKRFRCTAVGRVCYEATKLHSLGRTFWVNWSLLTFDFLEAFRGHEHYLKSQQAPYPLDESRVPRSSQRDGWMWMDGRCRCGIQSSSVQWFEIISHIKK